ncbi:MAG: 50S ribosome-binding GTPase [Lachnospiraceae bacterium]|nr:50S ribosome-binding GTPase [Lachnospiraceae bacterium]
MDIYRKNDIDNNLSLLHVRPLDVMIVGATGAGKSTTLNAIFNSEVAKVGRGVDPETMEIRDFSIERLIRFWDTPGLGDNIKKDEQYSKKMIDLLYEKYSYNSKNYGLVDMVLVVLDGTGRDMGSTYKLLRDVIVPNFPKDRILVGINQADMAMKGRHWNFMINKPDDTLEGFLEEKCNSVVERVKEATGIKIKKPVYYSGEQNYNIHKLMDFIIDNMPKERRKLVL